MEDKKDLKEKKQVYEEPKVLATYKKEDLEEAVRPHGQVPGECEGGLCGDDDGSGTGCGCGCGA
jgi:hypothetical protein